MRRFSLVAHFEGRNNGLRGPIERQISLSFLSTLLPSRLASAHPHR